MVDFNSFEFDYTTVVVLASVIAVLLLQLWLCCKAKRILVKLIPVAVLTLSTITFVACTVCVSGWDALGYLFFALLSFGLLVVCGGCWGIWAIARKIAK